MSVICEQCEDCELEEFEDCGEFAGYICPNARSFEPGVGCNRVVSSKEFKSRLAAAKTPKTSIKRTIEESSEDSEQDEAAEGDGDASEDEDSESDPNLSDEDEEEVTASKRPSSKKPATKALPTSSKTALSKVVGSKTTPFKSSACSFSRSSSTSTPSSSSVSDGRAALLRVLGSIKKPSAPSKSKADEEPEGSQSVVVRAALLPCLSVVGAEVACPALRQQFKLPRGVVSTEADDELRRKKTLGARRIWGAGFSAMKRVFASPSPEPLPLDITSEPSPPPPPPKIEEDYSNVEPLVLWEPSEEQLAANLDIKPIKVEPFLCKWLRPHQREGVRFLAECLTGQRDFDGCGSILADDMGLGKTLQSITLMFTLLRQGFAPGEPLARRCIIVCPTSLVSNWANEIKKWCGDRIKCVALSESSREKVLCGIADFLSPRPEYPVLVISYETMRMHAERFTNPECCELLIADEAHRLKNAETQTYTVLSQLSCKRRVLLSGTPMQNNLDEFYAMADLVNPGIFGDERLFRKQYITPILQGREPGASDTERTLASERSTALSQIVNKFVLRRTNALLSAHLPPKVIEVVCCKMTPLQTVLYEHFLKSKVVKSMLVDADSGVPAKPIAQVLPLITSLKKLCNHPKLVYDEARLAKDKKKSASGLDGIEDFFPQNFHRTSQFGVCPEMSGKMQVLDRLLSSVRATTDDRFVLISNYTQTLDLFASLCRERHWPFVRLDGSTSVKKRQKLVDQLSDRTKDTYVFLLSSKAGGCGLNLIGANRLVLFDPDWNPAVDKQAAARVWRDGQKKKCYIYRFLTVGTIEEKVYQRQLSKEGLQSVIGAGEIEETNASTEDLRDLFTLQSEHTLSDTHDTLECECLQTVTEEQITVARKAQVGAPKEEELEDWSHHSHLASVPDPVFAKSHGPPSLEPQPDNFVSFVFACEVSGCAVIESVAPSGAGKGTATSAPKRKFIGGFELPPASTSSSTPISRTTASPPDAKSKFKAPSLSKPSPVAQSTFSSSSSSASSSSSFSKSASPASSLVRKIDSSRNSPISTKRPKTEVSPPSPSSKSKIKIDDEEEDEYVDIDGLDDEDDEVAGSEINSPQLSIPSKSSQLSSSRSSPSSSVPSSRRSLNSNMTSATPSSSIFSSAPSSKLLDDDDIQILSPPQSSSHTNSAPSSSHSSPSLSGHSGNARPVTSSRLSLSSRNKANVPTSSAASSSKPSVSPSKVIEL